jgi:pyruvate/2-oxoglutarate dehydrogenase complex dihydrolipoamide dehydrogenase (E3) component
MAVDYDLVIVGGTPAGAIAANTAVRLGARVAWVWQGADLGQAQRQLQGWMWGTQRCVDAGWTAAIVGMPPLVLPDAAWQAVQQWADLIADLPRQPLTTAITMAGVDVIQGSGQVVGDGPLRLRVDDGPLDRTVSTRRLLLAMAGDPAPPAIVEGDAIPWLTPTSLAQQSQPPDSLIVLGQQPVALALAQALTTWGTQVHVLSSATTLLPQEDPAIGQWLQAQFAAMGIHLHLGASLQHIKKTAAGVDVTSATGTIQAAAALLGTVPRPLLQALHLKAVGLTVPPQGLTVNSYLQSDHPDIYGCGGSLGGYPLASISAYEAAIAVENALFWNRRRVDYRALPYGLWTQPEIGRVGLTEPQAQKRYGSAVQTYTCRWDEQPMAHWRGHPTGFCKLIVRAPGTLVGAHIVGPEAPSLAARVAPLVGKRHALKQLAQAPVPSGSPFVGVQQAAQQWQRDRWRSGQWRRDWAENWCHWRRSQRRS